MILTPISAHSNDTQDLVQETDSSKEDPCAVLNQTNIARNTQVLVYASQSLSKAEKNYSVS